VKSSGPPSPTGFRVRFSGVSESSTRSFSSGDDEDDGISVTSGVRREDALASMEMLRRM